MERNNMAKLAILHLSDLHFGDDKNYDSGHVRNIINAIRNTGVVKENNYNNRVLTDSHLLKNCAQSSG